MKLLAGKTALVTGAGQGIGRAVVERFALAGARVWATGRRLETLQDLDQPPAIRICRMDVTDTAAIAAAVRQIGDVDILVNNAGIVPTNTLTDCSPQDLQQTLNVNVMGVYEVTRAFIGGMLARNSGVIINIASVLSGFAAAPGRFAYCVSKAALIGFTKSVALDYVDRGIRCNAVCPGVIDTPGFQDRVAQSADPARTLKQIAGRQKIGRLGTGDEVAEACVYLASDPGALMTGQTMVLDGGMTL